MGEPGADGWARCEKCGRAAQIGPSVDLTALPHPPPEPAVDLSTPPPVSPVAPLPDLPALADLPELAQGLPVQPLAPDLPPTPDVTASDEQPHSHLPPPPPPPAERPPPPGWVPPPLPASSTSWSIGLGKGRRLGRSGAIVVIVVLVVAFLALGTLNSSGDDTSPTTTFDPALTADRRVATSTAVVVPGAGTGARDVILVAIAGPDRAPVLTRLHPVGATAASVWETPISEADAEGLLTIAGSRVYLLGQADLSAYSLQGALLWQRPIRSGNPADPMSDNAIQRPQNRPVVVGSALVLVSYGQQIEGVDPASGASLWTAPSPPSFGDVVTAGGRLFAFDVSFAGGEQGRPVMTELDPSTGKVETSWPVPCGTEVPGTPEMLTLPPAVRLIPGSTDVVAASIGPRVCLGRIDMATGTVPWSRGFDSTWSSAVLRGEVGDGRLVVSDGAQTHRQIVDVATGAGQDITIGNGLTIDPVLLSGGQTYVQTGDATQDGRFGAMAIDSATGKERWYLPGVPSGTGIAPDSPLPQTGAGSRPDHTLERLMATTDGKRRVLAIGATGGGALHPLDAATGELGAPSATQQVPELPEMADLPASDDKTVTALSPSGDQVVVVTGPYVTGLPLGGSTGAWSWPPAN